MWEVFYILITCHFISIHTEFTPIYKFSKQMTVLPLFLCTHHKYSAFPTNIILCKRICKTTLLLPVSTSDWTCWCLKYSESDSATWQVKMKANHFTEDCPPTNLQTEIMTLINVNLNGKNQAENKFQIIQNLLHLESNINKDCRKIVLIQSYFYMFLNFLNGNISRDIHFQKPFEKHSSY